MANEISNQGNQNIIIQRVSENTITVNVNGEIQEIQNQLSELKELLKNRQTQNIQYAEKIYNIEHINEANFGLMLGKKAFNELITKQLIEAIAPYSVDAKKILDYVASQKINDWETQAKYAKKAKEIIAYSLVGILGIQFSKVIAIGNEENTEAKPKKYLEKILFLVKRSLDLIIFTSLSKLWDIKEQLQTPISDTANQSLSAFFDREFEPDILQNIQLLADILQVFSLHNLKMPFAEAPDLEDYLAGNHDFYQTCQKLQALQDILDKEKYTLLDCAEAEKYLANFLCYLAFLANYKMASIKQIGYRHIRNSAPHFVHRYAALGIDNKANIDAEKFNYTPQTAATDAVLIYQGTHYQQSINLFPFVIDYNALTFESGAKICFYNCRNLTDGSLEYVFLEDGSNQNIEYKKVQIQNPDLNEIIADKEKFKTLNLDNVYLKFEEAKNLWQKEDDFDKMF